MIYSQNWFKYRRERNSERRLSHGCERGGRRAGAVDNEERGPRSARVLVRGCSRRGIARCLQPEQSSTILKQVPASLAHHVHKTFSTTLPSLQPVSGSDVDYECDGHYQLALRCATRRTWTCVRDFWHGERETTSFVFDSCTVCGSSQRRRRAGASYRRTV